MCESVFCLLGVGVCLCVCVCLRVWVCVRLGVSSYIFSKVEIVGQYYGANVLEL